MAYNFLKRSITGLLFALITLGLIIHFSSYFIGILIAAASWIAFIELPSLARPNYLLYWILLCFYIVAPFTLMILMILWGAGNKLAFIFLLAFTHDSAAYAFGKLFGKHRMAPKISPGKTWQGFLGGILGLWCLLAFFHYPFSAQIMGKACIYAFIATLGDLFESWLKRRAHRKDAGSLLPGHGGLLDRFDSIIALVLAFQLFSLIIP